MVVKLQVRDLTGQMYGGLAKVLVPILVGLDFAENGFF